VVVGDRDQYCPRDALERLGVRRTIIAGADHFFARIEAAVGRTVADLLADL
jgi:alpha/beta superfamily hydrolase